MLFHRVLPRSGPTPSLAARSGTGQWPLAGATFMSQLGNGIGFRNEGERRMSALFRTAAGGRVERGRTLRFRFDGRDYAGVAGDTLASALLANGVHLVGRSFKYHRPRGIMAAGADEPNALVTVRRDAARTTPNLRATQVELYEGLVAESQNRWPSLGADLGAANDLFAPLLPAGFYYKTFMWPRRAWDRFYEPRIRAMAGLGRAPTASRSRPLPQPVRPLRRAGGGCRAGRPGRRADRSRERGARGLVR